MVPSRTYVTVSMPRCGCRSNTPSGNQSSIKRRNGSVAAQSPGGTRGRTRCVSVIPRATVGLSIRATSRLLRMVVIVVLPNTNVVSRSGSGPRVSLPEHPLHLIATKTALKDGGAVGEVAPDSEFTRIDGIEAEPLDKRGHHRAGVRASGDGQSATLRVAGRPSVVFNLVVADVIQRAHKPRLRQEPLHNLSAGRVALELRERAVGRRPVVHHVNGHFAG